jgi:glycosidase
MLKRWLLPFTLCLLLAAPLTAQDDTSGEQYWWNDRVFYEIFVRSFYDSDGDGVGDLRGVIEKLDYLNDGDPTTSTDLGITGIWLMPINESVSYHGYDVTDYRAVERDYGTLDDMRALIEAAHARGIAVIIDLVINHTSVQHEWFRASAENDPAYADWYVWQDQRPGYNGPDNQPVWHAYRDRFYYGVFWSGMPDLNLTHPPVRDEIYDITRYWLQDIGVDGFRLDAIKHLVEDGEEQESTPSTLAWLADYHDYIDSVNPQALTVGEVYDSQFISAQYVPEQTDIVFDFDSAVAFMTSARQRRPDAIRSIMGRVADLYPRGQYATFITNHDQNRVMEEVRGNIDQAKIAASLMLTTPGVPFIYYGEEIGMSGRKPDERIRTPFRWDQSANGGFTTAADPWQPLSDDALTISVGAQTADPASLLSHYRALIQLRGAYPVLARGTFAPLEIETSRHVYAFVRQEGEQSVLVVLNLNDEPVSDYGVVLADVTLDSPVLLFGSPDGFSAPQANTTYKPYETLPAYSTFIIEL